MPRPTRPPALHRRVFRGTHAVSAGHLTVRGLRSSAWRRIYRDVYADAQLPDSLDLRILGATLIVPASAAFSGRTAAWLHGARDLTDLRDPIEVSVPAAVRFGPVTGLRIRRLDLRPADVTTIDRCRCTRPLRTALDIVRTEQLTEGVSALDVLLRRGVVRLDELPSALDDVSSTRGVARAREAIRLADGRAESIPESRVRVLLALSGMVAVPQYTVRDADGAFVARVDLAFPELRVAVEYDGAWHGDKRQFAADRRRLNRLVAAGWTVIHVTASDLREPDALVARVRAQLRRTTAGK